MTAISIKNKFVKKQHCNACSVSSLSRARRLSISVAVFSYTVSVCVCILATFINKCIGIVVTSAA